MLYIENKFQSAIIPIFQKNIRYCYENEEKILIFNTNNQFISILTCPQYIGEEKNETIPSSTVNPIV